MVCSSRAGALAGASRHTQASVTVPNPLSDSAEFVAAVRALVKQWQIDVLIPVSEAALLAILPERHAFGCTIPFPEYDQFAAISDKALLTTVARELGIKTPAQHILTSRTHAKDSSWGGVGFPAVLKPARSVSISNGTRAKGGVQHVADPSQLTTALAALPADAYPLLLQERIVGPGVGVFLLHWDDDLCAQFFHRRIREKPPSGGVSVYSESIAPNPDLLQHSNALLRRFKWQGVAMVEYKLDAATGTPYLMEVNGRFWGSLQLAVDAGVDFPAVLLAAAAGNRPREIPKYRVGVRSRWWWGDFDHLVARIRYSPDQLALPADAHGRGRALLDFMAASGRGTRNEVFRPSDPIPALRETVNWFRRR